MRRYFLVLISIILCNCSSNDIENHDSKIITLASEKRSCQGIIQQSCFLIKEKENDSWELFYDEIKGFNYEEGFEYLLLISEKDINSVPADASSKETTLIRIISKEKKTSSNLP